MVKGQQDALVRNEQLAEAMAAKKVSLRELEAQTGVTRQTIARMLNGEPVQEGKARQVCRHLGVKVTEMGIVFWRP